MKLIFCSDFWSGRRSSVRGSKPRIQLAGRLETRKVVDRAKGILQRDLEITEDEAYRTMQRESRQRRRPMREIAEAILLGDDLKKRTVTEESVSQTKG